MCNEHDDEYCPACSDVTDADPYYGECLACGRLDPRGAPAKALTEVEELRELLRETIAQCYTRSKPMQDPLRIRIEAVLNRDHGQGN
jgi:hypothetical protein